MPDENGRIRPISVPRVPWHEAKITLHKPEHGEVETAWRTSHELDDFVDISLVTCSVCRSSDVPCRCPD